MTSTESSIVGTPDDEAPAENQDEHSYDVGTFGDEFAFYQVVG